MSNPAHRGTPAQNRKRAQQKRPEGQNWYGTPTTKRSLIAMAKAARRTPGPKPDISLKVLGNLAMGWPGGSRGGWTDVHKLSAQHGEPNGSESKGRGKGRRSKRRP